MVSDSRKEELIKKVINADGDLGKLAPKEREDYYISVCESLGLNPMTQPFNYLTLRDRRTGRAKLVLYAKRDCTDQLSSMQKLSRQIIEEKVLFESIYTVTARVTSPDGRITENTGKVNIRGLAGDDLANALMKAETKAFRRAILGHCGLGFNDETEVETIPEAIIGSVPAPEKTKAPEKTQAPEETAQPQAAETPKPEKKPAKEPPNGNGKKGSKKQEQGSGQDKPQPYEGTVVVTGDIKRQNEYTGAKAVDAATDSQVFVLTKDPNIAAKLAPGATLYIVKGLINNNVVMIQEAEIKAAAEPAEPAPQGTAAEPEAPSESPASEPEASSGPASEPAPSEPKSFSATIVGDPKEAPYNGAKTLYVYGVVNDEKVCLVGDALNGVTAGSIVEVQGEWTTGRGNVKVLLISNLRLLESKVA